ncbi:glucose 1-dehydrogenase [Pseudomonas sp. ADAK2]|uniref:SDR family NAD(P)-dependent oxidoreductase n=1 Tax=unclassified Pseudomonas TaxID=196821 RepID=UPI0014628CCA|nr:MULTISPECIES: glucose 1-dehydrogenase [unclassified Pseudomonas]QJI40149.1 glucose 1-dehydrogenase [Pseudomonas sp. ADAK7]QJI46454.1 glucose 1-dehydrogenase [Pseudomonas sp. ADAK2]
MRFIDQVAIVTGSSSGNGRAIALALAAEGARIVCSDLVQKARPEGFEADLDIDTDALIRKQGGQAVYVKADVSKSADVENLVKQAVEHFGRLDVMINNAGVCIELKTIVEETEADYDLTMNVNTKGVWLGCKFAITQMLKQPPRADGTRGRIVNVSSIGGLVGLAQEPSYCASKGAVNNLTRQLAVDFAAEKINVNAICPGFLATAMVRQELDDPKIKAILESLTPWPRIGNVQDVAKAVTFLASDDAQWMTGSLLTVDGAYTAQ